MMMGGFRLLELCFLFGGQHLVDLLPAFLVRFLDDLHDGRLLVGGEVQLVKARRQMGPVHLAGRRTWGRGVVIGPCCLKAQEGAGAKAKKEETNGCFHYYS